ncbi:MAG: flagellar assembly peptidoglycan hydrolase FlgJ [Rhodocyclaceae bacterium]|nr:flagellar assembly peptidoglycan hydrolase FlgJ [Rhodocyclaceae bacterium]
MTASSATPSVFDVSSLTALKGAARKDDPKALKAAAQQFEALFLNMVLKSMRDATPKEGLFDSDQTRLYESLLDQQLAQVMSAKGSTGLAAMIEKQLSQGLTTEVEEFEGLPLMPPARSYPLKPVASPSLPAGAALADITPAAQEAATPAAREFVARVWPQALEASRTTGIPPQFMVAQAALETGWGKSEPRRDDGSPSFNLFGIKAGRNWNGPVVEAGTTEYVNGVPQRQVERFRAYGSYAEAFRDYADLLRSNPRYTAVLGTQDASSFALGLARAGYATDPNYADKLMRIIGGANMKVALGG